ncbi:MAG: alpha/beta hydrolase [Chloroflexi bacterium]|nr:alpha/beta hydrolase [Chloroflexota bacterium]
MRRDWRYWARLILAFTSGLALGLFLLVAGLTYASVEDILHPPRRIPPGTTLREERVDFFNLDLYTEDGIRLTAWYTPPENGALILLAHGYGDNRPEWVHAILAKNGYGVLAWDARAHGESEGEISTLGYLEVLDVRAALDYALTQPQVEHIGAWGGSMGGATMIRATARFPEIEALVVDSSFSTLGEELDHLVPYPLVNPLAKFFAGIRTGLEIDALRPVDEIARISPRPVFIIHGGADTLAPPESAQALYDAAGEPRRLWIEEDAPHLAVVLANPSRYSRRVVRFFDEWLLNKE